MDKSIQEALAAPFADADIEWRLQWTDEQNSGGLAVPYLTNRAIQNRLDAVVGIDGWKNDYVPWHSDGKKASQICGISIYFPQRGEWVQKFDGAENTDIEAIKGGLSDSMKRAAVQWGLGRYLYSTDSVYVSTEKRGKTTYIKASEQSKLDRAHRAAIAKVFGGSDTAPETPAPKQEAAPPKRLEPKSPPTQAQNAYQVIKVTLQPNMQRGSNTVLQLKGPDGRLHLVHMLGENPELVPGVWITETSIKKTPKGDLVFYVLESFRLMPQAA